MFAKGSGDFNLFSSFLFFFSFKRIYTQIYKYSIFSFKFGPNFHIRLMNFDRKEWQGSYKALMLLERLLTHGPISTVKEFEDIIEDVIKNMASFQHIDQKGYLLTWHASIYIYI